MQNYYVILEIASDSSLHAVRAAYRRLAQKLHPDVNNSVDAHEQMILINEAYEILSDTAKRKNYDLYLSNNKTVKAMAKRSESKNRTKQASSTLQATLSRYTLLKGHEASVYSVSWDNSGNLLATGSFDNTLKIWTREGNEMASYPIHSGTLSITGFFGEAPIAAGAGEKTVQIFQVTSDSVLKSLKNKTQWVTCLCFNSAGTMLATGSGCEDVKLWNTSSGKLIRTLRDHEDSVTALAFDSANKLLASAEKSIKIWDISTGVKLSDLRGHRATIISMAFSPSKELLATGSVDRLIKIWDIKSGNLVHTLEGHGDWVESLSFNSSGTILASGSGDKSIRMWNVSDGEELYNIRAHDARIYNIAFSPNDKYLASCGMDKSTKIWRVHIIDK